MKTKYDSNDIMRLIGHQGTKPLFDGGLKDLKFIANAYGYKTSPEIMFDSFLLGCIYGKRAERLKRKKTFIGGYRKVGFAA